MIVPAPAAAVGIAVMCPRSAPIQTIAQQATGINSIMYYGTQVLTVAGFSASAALIANVANGVLAVVGSAVCLFS